MTAFPSGPQHELALLAGQPDAPFDLAEAALALAALDHPLRDRAGPRGLLDEMAAAVGAAAAEEGDDLPALARARILSAVLLERYRLIGDDDEPDRPNLMQVLDSRRGPPAPLGILWLAVARRLNWPAEALAFPHRLLVRLTDGDGRRAILDPYDGGGALTAAGMRALLKLVSGSGAELEQAHHAILSDREVLLRLQATLKFTHLRLGRLRDAARSVDATLLFAPGQTPLWRELGLMNLRLGDLTGAIAALEQFVARTSPSPTRQRVIALLAELRGKRRS